MSQFDIDRVINNAEKQSQKKKKKYDIDRILNNAEDISTRNTTMGTMPAITSSTIQATNKLIAPMAKSTTNLTDADLRKIEQNSGMKSGTLNLNQMQAQQQKFENLQQKGNEILQDNNKMYDIDYIYSDLGIDNGKVFKKSSAFKDGYDFGDITKTVLDTGATLGTEAVKGIANIGENIGDLASYGIAGVADLLGKDEYADKVRKNAQISLVDKYTKPLSSKIDKNSILGNKGKEMAQSLGYVAGTAAIGAATGGTAGILGKTAEGAAKAANIATTATTFASSMGNGITEAYQSGATDQEALAYGIISGIGEAGSELMFGGLGKVFGKVGFNPTGGALDEVVVQGLSKNIKNKMVKTLVQSGLMATGEGIEEIVAGVVSAIGKKATFMKEEDLKNILQDEDLAEQFWMGALTSVIAQVPSTISSIKNKTDYLTGEKLETTQKHETPELSQNVQNNIEQQTVQTDTKTAQNQNIQETKPNGINTPIKELDYFETAKKYNIDTKNDTVQSIARVTNERGIKARYDVDVFTDNSQNAIWKISKDNNGNITREVIINPNADTKKSLENIAIHELTHDLEGTEQYNKLRDLILEYDKTKSGYQEARQSLEELYSNVYDKNSEEFNTLVDSEAVADILGSKLGNQEFVNNLTIKNKNLGQRLYSWVIDKLNRLNAKLGYKSEKIYWTDVKNKFENAFKQEYNGLNTNTNRLSIAGIQGMNNAMKADTSNIFLERMFNKAHQMKKYGIDNETIRQRTNWFQDKNGDWKFEFTDRDMSLKNNIKIEEDSSQHLGDILKHDTLFMVYPELKDINVKFSNMGDINGSYNAKHNRISLNNSMVNNNRAIEGTLIHEIQHAIQKIENFERGAKSNKSKLAYYNSLGEIEAADTKARFLNEKYKNKNISGIAPESSKANPKHKELNKYLENRKIIDKAKDNIYNYFKKKGDYNENFEYFERNEKQDNKEDSKLVSERNRRSSGSNGALGDSTLENGRKIAEKVQENETKIYSKDKEIRKTTQQNGEKDNDKIWNNRIDGKTQESENNSGSFSLSESNKWQERLDTLYKNDSKGTTIRETKAPIQKFLDDRAIDYEVDEHDNIINIEEPKMINEFYNSSNDTTQNIAPIGKNVKRSPLIEKTAPIGENVVMYNNYKKKIIKTQENAINNLIKYKNFSISNIDETIRKKENIINGKKNKDTKTVAIIKSQIENLKIRKNKIEDLYLSKIDKVNKNSTKEKVELETRNMMKKASRETITAEIAPLVSDLTKYEDKKSGILYNRETAQRNIEDIVKDKELAKTINEVIFNPIQVHQAQKTREINELYEKINKLDLDKTQKYLYVPKGENIAIKIDEATLAQLIIEKKINDTDLRKYNLSNEKIQKIYKTANTFKEILDYLHPRINDEQIKFGFSPIGKRENYFPHFFENKPDMFLGKVASYFGIDLSNNNSLPTEIAGKTDTFKPGRTWNSNIQKRRTNKTDYNALKAMEKYIQGAMELIYTTEDIQKVREFSRQIRYKFSDKGMQNEINNIYKNKELTQEAKDSAIDGIFKNTESGLPNFVTWLDDYANTLAGKKSFADRNIEHNIGRNVYTSMAGIESKIAANTIGGNLSVSLTNFAPIFQAAGTTKWNYLLTGILQTAKNDIQGLRGNKDLSFVSNSNFLTNRFGIDTIAKKKITQKMSDIASIPMNVIDNFTAESVVRAKYLENIDKGMSEEIALDSADKYAARIMADRSKGALPLVFNSRNPLSKLITMFQVEPNNMVSNYLKDMPREAKNKGQLIWHYSKLMAASWGVNTIMIALRGGNEVLPDPVRWVSYLIQAILGDDDDKEKAKEDLAESVIGSIPFLSNLAGFVGMEDIGRVPISNAMPNITNIAKLADSEADEKYKKEIAIKEFTKPLLYLGLPVGGAQIKKSIEGISTINAGGSYKTNKSGESQLQFPVENKTVKKYIKAGLFGKYSISDAKEFSERGYKALSSKQTEGYKKVQIPYKEFLEYIDNTSGKKKNEKIQYIEKMNINENKKWNMYTYDVFSATERNDGGSQLKDAEYITKNGTSKVEYIRIYNKANENELSMPTKEEYDNLRKNGLELETFIDYKIKIKELSIKLSLKEEKMKSNDKINILLKSNYSAKEKSAIYKTKILTNDSAKEKFELLEKTGITDEKYINEYLKYLQQDFESDIKENGTTKGKTVSGSSKKKTYEYVNNMKITYEQKLMLLGTQYKLNDTERTKLYKYVKSLDYTEDEMKSVFESLKGFTVYKNGKVAW